MPTSQQQPPDHRHRPGLHSADGGGDSAAENDLRNASSVLGMDVNGLRALLDPSPYRKIPVRLTLLDDALIYVSTPHRAEELMAADRSYRLTVR